MLTIVARTVKAAARKAAQAAVVPLRSQYADEQCARNEWQAELCARLTACSVRR
jgi:hypothetical protein